MADPYEELSNVRPAFVERVSLEVIKQVLDGLLEDRMLNSEEMESVLEMNVTRADKARALIKCVMNKGRKTSRRMIDLLQQKDSALHEELGLSSAQPAASPPAAQSRSTAPECTIEEFWNTKQSNSNVYPVAKDSYQNRVALVITNITFSNKTKRNGAEKDEENMENLLQSLGYEVVKHRNLTGKAIEEALREFSKHPKLKETDSVFVVIMSFGKLGAVLGVDWKEDDQKPDEFLINDIFKLLCPIKCPHLVNKPKIIIIQACRGVQTGFLVINGPNQDDYASQSIQKDFEEDGIHFIHKEKDFIFLLSCTPDTVSYRHHTRGSLLIQYIVEIFRADAHQEHVLELFRKVMKRFEELKGTSMQMPTIDRCTLTKHFYLFPGLVAPKP